MLLFLGATLIVLGVDLVVKWQAFEHVAPLPLRLGPNAEVFVYHPVEPGQSQWLEVQPLIPGEPASAIPTHVPTPVIPGVLNLQLTLNQGAVFGIGQGLRWIFIVVSIAAVGVVTYLFAQSVAGAWLLHLALGLILAGALGNLYDRLRFGAVRDMFLLFPEMRLWPYIWNIADASLMLGVGLVLVQSIRGENVPAETSTQRSAKSE